jgi:monoterpene epsilon-lactone hydrolase
MPVLGVDYRLAPEFCFFPDQVNDAIDAYQFLLAREWTATSIVPEGISAGGTLVLSLLLSARDRKIPLRACAACMSPAVKHAVRRSFGQGKPLHGLDNA